MATKKEIKEVLEQLNITEEEMDILWDELKETNALVRNLSKNLVGWRGLNTHVIKQIPTQKEKDIESAKKKEREEKEKKEKKEKEYYQNHFEEIMVKKIDNKENLKEQELREIMINYEIERKEHDNRRWTRTVESILEMCNRNFCLIWEEGLTECQENEFYEQPFEVVKKEYEKTITVTEWIQK